MPEKKNTSKENGNERVQEILDQLKASIDKYEEAEAPKKEVSAPDDDKFDFDAFLEEMRQIEKENSEAEKAETEAEKEAEEPELTEEPELAEEYEDEEEEEESEPEEIEEALDEDEEELGEIEELNAFLCDIGEIAEDEADFVEEDEETVEDEDKIVVEEETAEEFEEVLAEADEIIEESGEFIDDEEELLDKTEDFVEAEKDEEELEEASEKTVHFDTCFEDKPDYGDVEAEEDEDDDDEPPFFVSENTSSFHIFEDNEKKETVEEFEGPEEIDREGYEEETRSFGILDAKPDFDNTVDISALGSYDKKTEENEAEKEREYKSRSFRIRLRERSSLAMPELGTDEKSEEEDDYSFLDDIFESKRKTVEKPTVEKREETFDELGDLEDPTEIFASDGSDSTKELERPRFTPVKEEKPPLADDVNAGEDYDVSAFFIKDEEEERNEGVKSGGEYVSRNQVEKIASDYSNSILKSKIKIITVALLALILLVLENAIYVGVNIPKLLHIAPSSAYALLDLQVFVIGCAIAYADFYHGIAAIAKNKIIPESFVVCLSLTTIVYNIALCISGKDYPPMYSFPTIVLILLYLVARHIELVGESDTFTCVSSQGDKLVADVIPIENVSQSVRDSFVAKKKELEVMRIKKVGFVDGYFARMSKKCDDYKLNKILLLSSFGFSLVMGALSLILSPEISFISFISAFLASLLFSVGFSTFFSHVWPVFVLEKKATSSECAIMGESSVNEYADVSLISFEDVEAFPTAKARINGIKVFNDVRPDEVFYYLSSVFALIGGPLCGIFREAFAELGISHNVKLTESTQNGLTAVVDGREFRIGKGTYMEKNGITLFYDSDDEFQLEKGNVSAMFISEGEELLAKFYIEYNISTRFVANALKLKENGILSVIRTYDPNIDERLIEKISSLDSSFVSVVKKDETQIYDYAQLRVNSGLVTGSISKEIVKMVFSCIRTKKVIERGKTLKIVSTAVGMLASLVSVILGIISALPSVTMTLVSLLTLMPVLILGKTVSKD